MKGKRYDEIFDSDTCVLCLDPGCKGFLHDETHIPVEYFLRRITRCGDGGCEKVTVRLSGSDLEQLKNKEARFRSRIRESLEKLVEEGEDKSKLGCQIVGTFDVDGMELPGTAMYQIVNGRLYSKYSNPHLDTVHIDKPKEQYTADEDSSDAFAEYFLKSALFH